MRLLDEARGVGAALRVAAPTRVGLAVRAGLCVALPLVVGLATGHPAAGAAASLAGWPG